MSYSRYYDRTKSSNDYEGSYEGYPYGEIAKTVFKYGVVLVIGALITLAVTYASAAETPATFEFESFTPATFTPDLVPTDLGSELSVAPASFDTMSSTEFFFPTETKFSATDSAEFTTFTTPASFSSGFTLTAFGEAGFTPTGFTTGFTPFMTSLS